MSHFENGTYEPDVKPLKPLSRSVSIIGVGATPFMNILQDSEYAGLAEGELFGYAAIEAMKDAGVTPKDIDYYFHGAATPTFASNYVTPNMQVANWFGMKGKPSSHHSEACCTGYVALEQAVNMVASGAADIVLSGCVETAVSNAIPMKPSFMRRETTMEELVPNLHSLWSKDYTDPSKAANAMCADAWLDEYVRENDLTREQVDDVLCAMAKSNREAAVRNPLGGSTETYDEIGSQFGMSADEFLRSQFNPFASQYLRMSNFEQDFDGAAAVIVCPTEMAYKFTNHPIEVVATGHSCLEGSTARLEKYATAAAYKQVKDFTGLTGADMDLFLANDFMMPSQLLAAEECEYLPKGEGWKYYLEGRNAYTGDRPINTSGGRCHFGHAHGASGLQDVYEAVKQMRGEAGETQVQHPVEYVMLRGFGGGQNVTCTILKNTAASDSEQDPATEAPEKKTYEAVTKKFYDALEEGKVMGRKCPECGHVEFPPYIACNDCGSLETEWVDLTEAPAVATSLVAPSMLFGDPEFNERYASNYCFATVQVEGADEYNTCVVDITPERREELSRQVPVPVVPEIVQEDGYKMVFWKLAE